MVARIKSLPGVPPPAPRAKHARKRGKGAGPEAQLSKAVRELLTLRKAFWLRLNSGTLYVGGRCIRLGVSGCSDLLLILRGAAYFLELKAPRGRQRPSQAAFQRSVEAAGASYVIVRSVREVEALLEGRQ